MRCRHRSVATSDLNCQARRGRRYHPTLRQTSTISTNSLFNNRELSLRYNSENKNNISDRNKISHSQYSSFSTLSRYPWLVFSCLPFFTIYWNRIMKWPHTHAHQMISYQNQAREDGPKRTSRHGRAKFRLDLCTRTPLAFLCQS